MSNFRLVLKEMYKSQDAIPALIEVFSGDDKHALERKRSISDYYVDVVLRRGSLKVSIELMGDTLHKGEKVELERLLDKDQKVLVTGVAGVGKSTLMQYIAHNWGCDKLWTEKFDYVYKVSFKTFAKSGCRMYIDTNKNTLRAFIAYNLSETAHNLWTLKGRPRKNKPKEPNEYLDSIVLGGRTLLLADGYDEVQFYRGLHEFEKLLGEILEQPQLVLTSRPNAAERLRNHFNVIVNNDGLDARGIEEFVGKHANWGTGDRIKDFLAKHTEIKKACRIPANAAAVCLYYKKAENGQGKVTEADLCTQMMVCLVRRFIERSQQYGDRKPTKVKEKIRSINKRTFDTIDEMKALKALALGAMECGGGLLFAEGDPGDQMPSTIYGAMEKTGKLLRLSSVYGLGLLTTKVDGSNVNHHQYGFMYTTFQEYLAAHELKTEAMAALEEGREEAVVKKLAAIRGEAKYAKVLELLGELVETEVSWAEVQVSMYKGATKGREVLHAAKRLKTMV